MRTRTWPFVVLRIQQNGDHCDFSEDTLKPRNARRERERESLLFGFRSAFLHAVLLGVLASASPARLVENKPPAYIAHAHFMLATGAYVTDGSSCQAHKRICHFPCANSASWQRNALHFLCVFLFKKQQTNFYPDCGESVILNSCPVLRAQSSVQYGGALRPLFERFSP